jgi:prevent-host-death family protein
MPEEYSIYDAKAKLSALVRQVREAGSTFVITVHGQPVAELRPIVPAEMPPKKQTLEERIAELTALGAIIPSKRPPGQKPHFRVGEPNPGALQRFLDERD